jgi:hypothetical protein
MMILQSEKIFSSHNIRDRVKNPQGQNDLDFVHCYPPPLSGESLMHNLNFQKGEF